MVIAPPNKGNVMGTVIDWDSPEAQLKESRSFDIPDDDYAVKVIEAKLEKAKSSDNMVINLMMEIQNDPNYSNLKIWDTLTITPKALWRIRQFIEAVGISVSGKSDLKDIIPQVEGLWCCVTVKAREETYQGVTKKKSRVIKYFKYGDDL